jgi:hypothetical protein
VQVPVFANFFAATQVNCKTEIFRCQLVAAPNIQSAGLDRQACNNLIPVLQRGDFDCLNLINNPIYPQESDAARRSSAISPIEIGWCGHILLHSPLFVSQPESAIFMHNFSIIYKSLYKSRISWRGDSVGAGVRTLQQIFAVCLECYNGVAIASRVKYSHPHRNLGQLLPPTAPLTAPKSCNTNPSSTLKNTRLRKNLKQLFFTF